MRPDVLCGQLAEPDRLRVFAAVVLGASAPADVVNATGLPVRTVMAALRKTIRGCPAPMELANAGHFVPEWGERIAANALACFLGS